MSNMADGCERCAAMYAEVQELSLVLRDVRDLLDDDPEDDAPDWYHRMVRRIDLVLGDADDDRESLAEGDHHYYTRLMPKDDHE